MKLLDLQKIADSGYADGDALETYFDPETGLPAKWTTGDALEWFVAIELSETFDAEASDHDQIAEAIRVLEGGQSDLQGAINALRLAMVERDV
jgi:hypothetical protein